MTTWMGTVNTLFCYPELLDCIKQLSFTSNISFKNMPMCVYEMAKIRLLIYLKTCKTNFEFFKKFFWLKLLDSTLRTWKRNISNCTKTVYIQSPVGNRDFFYLYYVKLFKLKWYMTHRSFNNKKNLIAHVASGGVDALTYTRKYWIWRNCPTHFVRGFIWDCPTLENLSNSQHS